MPVLTDKATLNRFPELCDFVWTNTPGNRPMKMEIVSLDYPVIGSALAILRRKTEYNIYECCCYLADIKRLESTGSWHLFGAIKGFNTTKLPNTKWYWAY